MLVSAAVVGKISTALLLLIGCYWPNTQPCPAASLTAVRLAVREVLSLLFLPTSVCPNENRMLCWVADMEIGGFVVIVILLLTVLLCVEC